MGERHRLDAECYDRTEEGVTALADAGVRTSRVGVYWSGLVPAKEFNPYYADEMGEKLRLFKRHGIEPIVVLTGAPPHLQGRDPEVLGANLARDVHRLAHDHGYADFTYWELWNEPDVGFDWRVFGVPPDRIVHDPPVEPAGLPSSLPWDEHLTVVGSRWNLIARAVRDVVPGRILSGGLGRPETLEHLDPALYDIASVHAYGASEHLLEQGRKARARIPEGRELWLTEHAATPPDMSDRAQARSIIDFARAHTADPVYDRTLLYVWHRTRMDRWYWLSDEAKEAVRAWNAGEIPLD